MCCCFSGIADRKQLFDVLKERFGLTTPVFSNSQVNSVNKTLVEEGTGQDRGHGVQSTTAYQQYVFGCVVL